MPARSASRPRRPPERLSFGRAIATATRRSAASLPLSLVVLAALGGCTTAGDVFGVSDVKPWERDTLAREDMQLVTDAMDEAVDDHVYFSKEASTGGGSVRGGGCGCN